MDAGRRAFLAGQAALVAAHYSSALAASPLLPARAQSREIELLAAPARLQLVGAEHPGTEVWAYNGRVPGPVIRVRQGETLRARLRNGLPQPTTVHWHGIRLPNRMDGVPGLTQDPVPPGGDFLYEFAVPDAGTFWYHPHASSSEQLGRGLYGALVVEEPEPPFADRDEVWVLSDFRLDRQARIVADFGHPRDASHNGRIGNTIAVNGYLRETFGVRRGERIRLRLVNAANARIFRLRFQNHAPVLIALDGHPVAPREVAEGIVLGPGMRADVMLDATGMPGERHRVVDDWYRDGAYRVLDLVYLPDARRDGPVRDAPAAPRDNPVPEPDLAGAQRLRLVLGGGAMSPQLARAAPEERRAIAERMRAGAMWTLNGQAHLDHVHEPLFRLARGRSYVMEIVNDTAWDHPVHLHGVAFRVLGDAQRAWRDTVLVAPGARVEIAFVADNPGDWMIHCHILEHQATGMMASMRIE